MWWPKDECFFCDLPQGFKIIVVTISGGPLALRNNESSYEVLVSFMVLNIKIGHLGFYDLDLN